MSRPDNAITKVKVYLQDDLVVCQKLLRDRASRAERSPSCSDALIPQRRHVTALA